MRATSHSSGAVLAIIARSIRAFLQAQAQISRPDIVDRPGRSSEKDRWRRDVARRWIDADHFRRDDQQGRYRFPPDSSNWRVCLRAPRSATIWRATVRLRLRKSQPIGAAAETRNGSTAFPAPRTASVRAAALPRPTDARSGTSAGNMSVTERMAGSHRSRSVVPQRTCSTDRTRRAPSAGAGGARHPSNLAQFASHCSRRCPARRPRATGSHGA